MGLLKTIGKGIAKALDVTTVSIAHPIKTATAVVSKKSTVQDVVTAHFAQPLKKQVTDIVLGTAGIASTIVGGAAIGGAAKAGTLAPKVATAAKALIPTTTKGKVIAAVAAPIVVGAVAKEPVKSAQAVAKAPSELAQFGGDVATFAANPSLTTAKEIVKESPVISAVAAAGILGGAATKILPAIATTQQTKAIEQQTKAIEAATSNVTTGGQAIVTTPLAPQTPITPETKPLIATAGSKPSTKRKKRSSKAVTQPIKQSVNVIVANRASSTGLRATKRIINREVLMN